MSGKSYTEEEIEATLSRSEQLLKYSEDLMIAGKVMFHKLGIPRGLTRRVLNHPQASENLKFVGQSQIQRWQAELTMATVGVAVSQPAVRKRKRSLIAL